MRNHTFHIPVMGIGFSIDTPLKAAPYGIDSVISLVDDMLIEKMRKMYCNQFELPYEEITKKVEDHRAKRITAYLNLINKLVKEKFNELTNSIEEKEKYLNLLPDSSSLEKENLLEENNISMGSIDVNIMTKLDKDNYGNEGKLPVEYNDAHAALRGYAESDLESSIVFSAGMNPRLYSYVEKFEDFYPDEKGRIKKKIILKVSDFRSAFIQGKFLAKKGLWISEYRIESGLNCGGHAFATDGFLMGPILEEFKIKREHLQNTIYDILLNTLRTKNFTIPDKMLDLKITAQGGVGTSEEHNFLLDHYKLDSVGWGTPFLLVPEITNVDESTLTQLQTAVEKDLYLSDISPLGVPFNSLRGNTKDIEKELLIQRGRPGSSCPKKYIEIHNKEFTEKNICIASRQYQYLKIKQLESMNLTPDEFKTEFEKVVEKSCICVGLGTSALLKNDLETKVEGEGVSICPGPNLAYFDKVVSLQKMINHIYGRENIISRNDRPHMFIKELKLYINFLDDKLEEARTNFSSKKQKYFENFAGNLKEGLYYYIKLFEESKWFANKKKEILSELEAGINSINLLLLEIENLAIKAEAAN